jgi:hypothetical protein
MTLGDRCKRASSAQVYEAGLQQHTVVIELDGVEHSSHQDTSAAGNDRQTIV